MKLLLIDDEDHKRNQILQFLLNEMSGIEVEEARSLQSGLKAVLTGEYSFIILDMTMPTFDITAEEDGGRPQAYAGRELLRHMTRRDIKVPSIVVTQYDQFGEGSNLLTLDQLNEQLKAENPVQYRGSVHYSISYDGWKNELAERISQALKEQLHYDSNTHY
jgi:CheY-like chemotaxis protein